MLSAFAQIIETQSPNPASLQKSRRTHKFLPARIFHPSSHTIPKFQCRRSHSHLISPLSPRPRSLHYGRLLRQNSAGRLQRHQVPRSTHQERTPQHQNPRAARPSPVAARSRFGRGANPHRLPGSLHAAKTHDIRPPLLHRSDRSARPERRQPCVLCPEQHPSTVCGSLATERSRSGKLHGELVCGMGGAARERVQEVLDCEPGG